MLIPRCGDRQALGFSKDSRVFPAVCYVGCGGTFCVNGEGGRLLFPFAFCFGSGGTFCVNGVGCSQFFSLHLFAKDVVARIVLPV